MFRYLLLLIFCCSSLSIFSQTKISGFVIDYKDGHSLSEVSVQLIHQKDSSIYKGTNTNEKGYFEFSQLLSDKYRLVVNFVGYQTYSKSLDIKNIDVEISLDTIKLKTDKYTTDEIKVESETPDFRFEDEKKIFDATKLTDTKGGNALDVLRKVPMIDVDMSDNVTLRGSSNVLILIDNKPMKFSSLRQLPADAIKNVEIITNPSAKYEAEGVTGIINIVMQEKNPDVIGYNGYLFTGAKTNFNNKNINLGFNIKLDKWSFFINGGGGGYKDVSSSDRSTYYLNPVSNFISNSNGTNDGNYGFFSLGAEYEIQKNHNLGSDFNFNISDHNSSNLSLNNNYNSFNVVDSKYNNTSSDNGNFSNFGLSFYYNGKFDTKGKELNAEFYVSKDKFKSESNQTQQYYDSLLNPIPNPNIQRNNSDNNNYNIKLQADYTHPFNDMTKLETGYKGLIKINDNDYTYDTLNYTTNNYVRSEGFSNHFKMNESINSIYGTFSHKIKDFKFKLGLRIEHTHTKGELITNNQNFTKDYFDIFPTLSLSQRLGLSSELQVSYSRRITRPNIWRLNPFINKSNARYISFGNPELSPEFTNSFELSYNFFSNIVNATTSVFFRKSTDVITSYSYIIENNITATTYRNGAKSQAYGADFIFRSNTTKWMNLNATFSFYKTRFDADAVNDYRSEEGFSWRANLRSNFTIVDLFKFDIFYNYNGKRFSATGFNNPMQSLDLSISKDFFKKKLTISVRAEDVFDSRKWGGENNGIGFKTVSNNKWSSRSIYVNFSCSFGNTDKYYQKSKKSKQNENENQDTKESN